MITTIGYGFGGSTEEDFLKTIQRYCETLLADEKTPCYVKPILEEVVLGAATMEDLTVRVEGFLAELSATAQAALGNYRKSPLTVNDPEKGAFKKSYNAFYALRPLAERVTPNKTREVSDQIESILKEIKILKEKALFAQKIAPFQEVLISASNTAIKYKEELALSAAALSAIALHHSSIGVTDVNAGTAFLLLTTSHFLGKGVSYLNSFIPFRKVASRIYSITSSLPKLNVENLTVAAGAAVSTVGLYKHREEILPILKNPLFFGPVLGASAAYVAYQKGASLCRNVVKFLTTPVIITL